MAGLRKRSERLAVVAKQSTFHWFVYFGFAIEAMPFLFQRAVQQTLCNGNFLIALYIFRGSYSCLIRHHWHQDYPRYSPVFNARILRALGIYDSQTFGDSATCQLRHCFSRQQQLIESAEQGKRMKNSGCLLLVDDFVVF